MALTGCVCVWGGLSKNHVHACDPFHKSRRLPWKIADTKCHKPVFYLIPFPPNWIRTMIRKKTWLCWIPSPSTDTATPADILHHVNNRRRASMNRVVEMCWADVFLLVGLCAWQILAELQCIFEAQGSPTANQTEVALSVRGWTGDFQQRTAWWKDAAVSWSRAPGFFLLHWLLRWNHFYWKLAGTPAVSWRTS